MKHGAIAAVWLFAISSGTPAIGQAAPQPVTAGEPIWATTSVQNEPLLFIQEEGQPTATAKLLYTPMGGFKITHPDLVMTYRPDIDYVWVPGSKLVTLTATSRIPYKTHAQMFPPKGSPNVHGEVLHSESHYFHDLQVQASYTTADKWEGPVPAGEPGKLKNTLAKLKAKQPVILVALGDSITAGLNASGHKEVNAPPYQPSYPELVGNTLQAQFGSKLTVLNLGASGSVSSAVFTQLDKVAQAKPDLVLVAYGMNHGERGDEHGTRMGPMLEALKKAVPQADIVLVSSMCGNPKAFQLSRFEGYRDALKKLEGPGVAVADLISVWGELLKKK